MKMTNAQKKFSMEKLEKILTEVIETIPDVKRKQSVTMGKAGFIAYSEQLLDRKLTESEKRNIQPGLYKVIL